MIVANDVAHSESHVELFLERELPRRKSLHYPPFARLILVSFRAASANDSQAAAESMAKFWRQTDTVRQEQAGEMLGPAPATVPRRARQYCHNILIKTQSVSSSTQLLQEFESICSADFRRRHVSWVVNVDPIDFF